MDSVSSGWSRLAGGHRPAGSISRRKTKAMTDSLKTFQLSDLARFTKEGAFSANASKDFALLMVGRDNVHEALKHVLSRVQTSLYLSMFGFADVELNDLLMEKAMDPSITVLITLDKSQSGGVGEKKLLDVDRLKDLQAF